MIKIENFDGSVTYRIEGIGVQETISEHTLNTLKRMPRTSNMSEYWYEDKIFMRLVLEWNDLLRNTNNQ